VYTCFRSARCSRCSITGEREIGECIDRWPSCEWWVHAPRGRISCEDMWVHFSILYSWDSILNSWARCRGAYVLFHHGQRRGHRPNCARFDIIQSCEGVMYWINDAHPLWPTTWLTNPPLPLSFVVCPNMINLQKWLSTMARGFWFLVVMKVNFGVCRACITFP